MARGRQGATQRSGSWTESAGGTNHFSGQSVRLGQDMLKLAAVWCQVVLSLSGIQIHPQYVGKKPRTGQSKAQDYREEEELGCIHYGAAKHRSQRQLRHLHGDCGDQNPHALAVVWPLEPWAMQFNILMDFVNARVSKIKQPLPKTS